MTRERQVFASIGCNQVHLRLIATSDLHSHIYPYDYFTDRPSDAVGLARTAWLIDEARAEAPNALVLDNGDFLQGNPLADYMAYERGPDSGVVHPMLRAMAAAGIEATTLGNHEFNYGLEFLTAVLARAPFPVVSANLATELGPTPAEDHTLVAPWTILEREVTDGAGVRHRLRIGIIGFAPPQILQWDHHHLTGRLAARDIVEAAVARVPELRAAGADLVVALAHTGIGAAEAVPGAENLVVALGAVPGIDAIVCGHSHRLFPSDEFAGRPGCDTETGRLNGTPAVMPGFWGSHAGLIDLHLVIGPEGWRVAEARASLRPIARRNGEEAIVPLVQSAPAILAAAAAEHEATLDYIRRPVGRLTVPLHSYFALVADCPSVQVVTAAQRAYVADMIAGTPLAALPLLSAAAPYKAGGRGGPEHYTDIPAGELALKHVADLYLFPNTISVLRISGAGLAEWLERSVAIYRRIEPGRPGQMLLDPEVPSYNFDVVEGVSYEVDLSQPARYDGDGRLIAPEARRIRNLSLNGQPVRPDQDFLLATNSYRAGGGGDYPGARPEAVVLSEPDTVRDVLLRSIHARGSIAPHPIGTWRFSPMPGTAALFDTGPGALALAPEHRPAGVAPVGPAPGGFWRYRLAL